MEIRQLKYFISAATHLNFTKAAGECFIVQTAMTQQIANLESEIGTKLFERHHRALALTEAGALFLQDAKAIVARSQRAAERVRSFEAGYAPVLHIGYHGEMFKQDLICILRELRRKVPKSKVLLFQLPQAELLEGLKDGQLDFIITLYGAYFETEEWMEWALLEEDRLMLVAAKDHPLANRDRVTMAEIEQEPLINFDERNNEERDIQLARNGLRPMEYGLVQDHTSGEVLVRSGYGVTIWVSRLCRKDIYPDLSFLEIEDHPGREQVVLVWRRDAMTPEKESFQTLVLEQFLSQNNLLKNNQNN